MGFFRGFFRTVLWQSQTLNAGQHRCKTGTVLRHSEHVPHQRCQWGQRGLPPWALLPSPCTHAAVNYCRFCYLLSYSLTITRIMKIMLTFLVLTVNYFILTARTPVCLAHFPSSHKTRLPSSGRATEHPGAGWKHTSKCLYWTEWAFPVVNATNQASRLKLNLALGWKFPYHRSI